MKPLRWIVLNRYTEEVMARVTDVGWEVAAQFAMERYGYSARVQDWPRSSPEQQALAERLPAVQIPKEMLVRFATRPRRRGNWMPGWHQMIRDLKASGEISKTPWAGSGARLRKMAEAGGAR